MKLEIELPQDEIYTAMRDIAGRLFARPEGYNGRGGPGYQVLIAQVAHWLDGQDFSALIQEEAARQLRAVIAEAVRTKLMAEVKRQAAEMAKVYKLIPAGE